MLYTLIRVGLILAAGVLLSLAGLRSWLLWITAILVGAMVSFLLLRRQTAEFSQSLTSLTPRRTAGRQAAQDAAAEDALVDQAAESEGDRAPRVGAAESEGGRGNQGDGEEDSVNQDQKPRP
ncbi:DUF4229 domain-containing protein [Bogoriella caseilytica]|uniref:DUF4229 domain-containing protein n=1 Tax=Bogoriella caseilytica TaxID=56055 RepID=UPI000F4A9E70|nr:DUF4229 domain-containing protein [Bogoriella caseilytica]